jgi:hypothetical protein
MFARGSRVWRHSWLILAWSLRCAVSLRSAIGTVLDCMGGTSRGPAPSLSLAPE